MMRQRDDDLRLTILYFFAVDDYFSSFTGVSRAKKESYNSPWSTMLSATKQCGGINMTQLQYCQYS